MKSIVIDGVTVTLDGHRVVLSAPAGHSVSVSRVGLFRALQELDDRPDTPPVPATGGADDANWVFLTVSEIRDNRACRYRTGAARGGPPVWGEWERGYLAVETREYDVPGAHRDQTRFWRRGDPASVAIVGRSDIPEYTPDELTVDGVFAADGGDRTILLQIVVPT